MLEPRTGTHATDRRTAYDELETMLGGLLAGERDWLANAANMASLLFHTLPDLNWVGFYRLVGGGLVLGPFQGKPACIRIAVGSGVCGTAVAERRSLVVEDVHEFPGHIACDEASQSELVVPVLIGDTLWGVLDLDSPRRARFDDVDRAGCERLVRIFRDASDFAT